MRLAVCETIATVIEHARKLQDGEELHLSGFRNRPQTLCGVPAAWDTHEILDLREFLKQDFTRRHFCIKCLDELREMLP